MIASLLRFDMRCPEGSPARLAELYAAALEMSAWADEQGFDSISLSEHHGVDDGFLPSPLSLAGAILGRTRRIRVGISALLVPLYDPVKLAEDLVVLDHVGRGRLTITAGMGYRPEEYASFGKDWDGRGKLFDECLEVMLRAWRGESFEWHGREVRVTPAPFSEPHPPVWIGGQSRAGARRAERFGLPYQPASNDPEMLELYVSECERLGVEHPLVLPPGSGEMIWVSEDPERSWAELGAYLLHDARTYASWQPANQRSAVHSDADSVDALRREGKYRILTPDECIARGRAAHASFILFPLCGGTPPALAWPSLELYAGRVLPALRGEVRKGGA